MKPGSFLETARDRARQASRTGGTLALTLGMLGVYLPHRKVKRMADDVDYRDAWVRAWSKGVLSCFRIHLEVIGEPPPRTGGRMIVSNHRSAIDINVVLSQFGGRMVSRHDIAGWPGLGWGAKLIGTVFVDRKDAKSGMVTIRAMLCSTSKTSTQPAISTILTRINLRISTLNSAGSLAIAP